MSSHYRVLLIISSPHTSIQSTGQFTTLPCCSAPSQLLQGPVSLLISVDPSIPPWVFLEKFWRRCLILRPAWHPTSCFQNFSLAFSYFTAATHRPQPPARPQLFLGGGGFLASMGPFQHKLFCDYILLSARRALSKTGGLVTHEGRLPTLSLARCPLMSRAATAEGPHSTRHLGNTSLSIRHPAGEWTAP